ncbi:MAG TPA: aldose epimerase [Gammaproteobacteria bacterium]|nr:aldose epimerase [Gammaproteobacteria bacterium]
MPQIKTTPIGKSYSISSPDGSTQATFIPERGGMASSIIMPGNSGPRELLFQHEYFWDSDFTRLTGGWPFCFPTCGRLERYGKEGYYFYDGHHYQLPIHGFAWRLPWQVAEYTDKRIILILEDNAETRIVYPFHFTLELDYTIESGVLLCAQTYTNRSDKPMPYYAGFHPYFSTPAFNQGKEKVILDFHPIKCLAYNETLTDLVGERDLYAVPTTITADINERLTQLGIDKTTRLIFPNGDIIEMTAGGVEDPDLFPYIQIYTPIEQPFICIEPWMGHPNAMNTVGGVRWLQPEQNEHGLLRLELHKT